MFSTTHQYEPTMQTYLISCDLHNAPQENAGLSKAIKDLAESWARPLGSTWYVRTDLPISEIEDRIGGHLDLEDCMLIQPVDEAAVTLNTTLRWFSPRTKPATPVPRRAVEHHVLSFARAS